MKVYIENKLFVVLLSLLLAGYEIEASSYNYSSSIKCLEDPVVPQYEGGLVENPEFDNGLKGWDVFGNGRIEVRRCTTGNPFIVAYHRTHPYDSFSQRLNLKQGLFYTFSAWVQISEGSETVVAAFRDARNLTIVVGSVIAQSGCWSMLKGGLTVDLNTQAELYFQSKNTSIELWVDSVSLQAFTASQWKDQQSKNINKIRKRNLRVHVSDEEGRKLQGVEITIKQTKPQFIIGCAIAETILDNKAYQKWFTARFSNTATVFNNEMKWYFVEKVKGHENYTIPDAMFAFAKQHGISVRGHTIVWDNPKNNMDWAKALSPKQLLSASIHRVGSVMAKYIGEVIAWDVMNENMHFSFYEDRIGPNASAVFYKIAQALDPKTPMYLNEFSTLEHPADLESTPSVYLQKFKEIRSFPGNERMVVGIGLQAHFAKPNIPYMRACLDTLGATKMPIWLTELDVERSPNQANYLEQIMREAYSHPAVEGIMVWSGWRPTGCSNMCLTDNNFKNLPVGDVVDKLLKEWKTKTLEGVTDDNGIYEHQVFNGEYLVTVLNPHTGKNLTKQFRVTHEKNSETSDFWISI